MPNIKSAEKRVKVIAKKNADNSVQRTVVKNALKKINSAIDVNDIAEAERLLPETFSALDKAATKGIITKNAASNKKSGIAKRIDDIKSGKKEVVIKKDNKTIAAEKAKAAAEAREAKKAEYAKKVAEKKAEAEAKATEEKPKRTRKAPAKKDAE